MSKRWIVRMKAKAYMKGSVSVEAETEQEALDLADSMVGDIVWSYDGVDEILDAVAHGE